MKITIEQLEYIETQLRDDGQLTLADQLKHCIKKITALTIPIEPPVKPDFAYIVDEYKRRIDNLMENNPKATFYNNGLRTAYNLLNQVLDDVEL